MVILISIQQNNDGVNISGSFDKHKRGDGFGNHYGLIYHIIEFDSLLHYQLCK